MNKCEAKERTLLAVDDALSERKPSEAPEKARYVGFDSRCGPVFVAVWSYLDVPMEDHEAVALAIDLLIEKGFAPDCLLSSDYLI